MKNKLISLVQLALAHESSDIHIILSDGILDIQLRNPRGMEVIHHDIWTPELFEYMKFISGFDLTNPYCPQSGQFSLTINGKEIFCRFSVIVNNNIQTGVLRLLRTNVALKISDLTMNQSHRQFLEQLCVARQGLIISSGPTNSGKTTTLHAILHEIALRKQFNVVSLEDPVEIEDSLYLQLSINNAIGFTYEKGIEELLRHDPDVILIGETRNSYTAKMVIRAALTGHLVFTTIHAKNSLETIQRLLDFGITEFDLKNTLTAIISQRLYLSNRPNRKECVYEILTKKALEYAIQNKEYPNGHKQLEDEITEAIKNGNIADKQAFFDIQDFQR